MEIRNKYSRQILGHEQELIYRSSGENALKDVEVNFDQNSEELKKAVFSLKKSHENIIGCRPLLITWDEEVEVSNKEWIMNVIDDACDGEYALIAFDSLYTVLDIAKSAPNELAENEMNNLFVFGSGSNFFIARLFKTKRGIVVYIGKMGFSIPISKDNKHRLFVKI